MSDVDTALKEAGIEDETIRKEYVQLLQKSMITNAVLLSSCDEKDLQKMGISIPVHAKAILKWAQRLQAALAPPAVLNAEIKDPELPPVDAKALAAAMTFVKKKKELEKKKRIERLRVRAAEEQAILNEEVDDKAAPDDPDADPDYDPYDEDAAPARGRSRDDDDDDYDENDDEDDDGYSRKKRSRASATRGRTGRGGGRRASRGLPVHQQQQVYQQHQQMQQQQQHQQQQYELAGSGAWNGNNSNSGNGEQGEGDGEYDHLRPRGRAPQGKKWDPSTGQWVGGEGMSYVFGAPNLLHQPRNFANEGENQEADNGGEDEDGGEEDDGEEDDA